MARINDDAPIVVLDVDGVLHPLRPSGHPLHASIDDLTRRADADLELDPDDESAIGGVVAGEFNEGCMAALARIVDASGAKIVLSSTWRQTAPQRRAVDAQLLRHGLPSVCGCTPILPLIGGGRSAEILAWAEQRPSSQRSWVAIDDTQLDGLPEGRFFKTDPATGLTAADVGKVLESLRGQTRGGSSLPDDLFCSGCSDTTRKMIHDAWLAAAELLTVTLIKGKALGVVAARDIAPGELLLQERPLLKLTPDGEGRYDGTYSGEREATRSLLASLSAAKPGAGDLGGVIETNGIIVNHGQVDAFTVVQLMISRCNHSCAPNAAFSWDEELQLGRLVAKGPIRATTEVTINYGAFGSRARRQRMLFRRFNFTCSCELCSLRGEALEQSDAHEEEMRMQRFVSLSEGDAEP